MDRLRAAVCASARQVASCTGPSRFIAPSLCGVEPVPWKLFGLLLRSLRLPSQYPRPMTVIVKNRRHGIAPYVAILPRPCLLSVDGCGACARGGIWRCCDDGARLVFCPVPSRLWVLANRNDRRLVRGLVHQLWDRSERRQPRRGQHGERDAGAFPGHGCVLHLSER